MNDVPLLETLIYSTTNIPFTHLNCSVKDSPQGQLKYSTVGGKTQFEIIHFYALLKDTPYEIFYNC